MQRFFLFLLLCLFTSGLIAQDLYTVRVGVFRDVKASDFNNLKTFGFVYGTSGADNTTDVFVGQYTDLTRANGIAENLKQQGFRNAQTFSIPATSGEAVTVIQLGLIANDRPVDWASMERAGQLFVESVDGVSKVVTGIYPDSPTALQFLSTIRELGYRDAFVKRINNLRLIPISTFETGIKKPLIPITLQDAPPPAPASAPPTTSANPNSGNAPAAAGPVTYGSPVVARSPEPAPNAAAVPSTAPSVLPAEANVGGLPAIDGKAKRHSSAELQRVLKEKGFYEGSIDGLYGPGTTSAYLAAWDNMPEIRKYRLLSSLHANAPAGINWPEVAVLNAVVDDIAASNANAGRSGQLLQQAAALFNTRVAISPAAATRARNWATTIWTNLEDWATEDPLHASIFSAFRLSYHQSQVRMEDRFMDAGMSATEARDAATALLQNLVGAQLDRFL